MPRKTIISLIATAAFWLVCGQDISHAYTFGFDAITNKNASNVAIGENQFFVDVTASYSATNQVLFTFTNEGLAASSIADVYFDDGTLLGIAKINNSDGVSFAIDAKPANLPSGKNASPEFVATAGFTADSDSPVAKNGVDPYETLGILFNLKPDKTFNDVIADLANGDLRVGIHAQYGNDGSESFVNIPAPIASPALLLASGFLALSCLRRKKSSISP